MQDLVQVDPADSVVSSRPRIFQGWKKPLVDPGDDGAPVLFCHCCCLTGVKLLII